MLWRDSAAARGIDEFLIAPNVAVGAEQRLLGRSGFMRRLAFAGWRGWERSTTEGSAIKISRAFAAPQLAGRPSCRLAIHWNQWRRECASGSATLAAAERPLRPRASRTRSSL